MTQVRILRAAAVAVRLGISASQTLAGKPMILVRKYKKPAAMEPRVKFVSTSRGNKCAREDISTG